MPLGGSFPESDYETLIRTLLNKRCNPAQLVTFSNSANGALIPVKYKNVSCPRSPKLATFNISKTALLSFPGSGNTWTKHLLQQMTGIATGSIYRKNTAHTPPFPYEGYTDNVIAVKTHGAIHDTVSGYIPIGKFDRAIILLRNVYESIISEYKRHSSGLNIDHSWNSYIDVTDPKWESFVLWKLSEWFRFMKDAFEYKGSRLIVFYNDLKGDHITQLTRIARFLQEENLKEFALCCVNTYNEGNYHRPANNQTKENVFSMEQRRLINEEIEKVAACLSLSNPSISKRVLAYRLPIE